MTEELEYIKLHLGVKDNRVERLWVRSKEQANTSDAFVGVYFRPPDQKEEVDKAFYRQMKLAS